jgi:TolB protein
VAGLIAVAVASAAAQPGQGRSSNVPDRARSGIYLLDLRHRVPHLLVPANAGAIYDSPAWSPDGRRIAFSGSPCDDCPPTIFVVNRNGRHLHRLKTRVPAERPSWAPSGKRIAFIGGSGGDAVYTTAADGSDLRLLQGGPAAHDQAVWSPNGNRLAFTRQQRDGRWDIYIMNSDGTHVRALTRTPEAEEQPAWSPDGRRIAFIRQAGGRWSIWIMTADGRNTRRLTPARNAENPAWSPDGRQIAFAQVGPNRITLYLMRADGRNARPIRTGLLKSFTPAWSPTGQTLAFAGIASTAPGS